MCVTVRETITATKKTYLYKVVVPAGDGLYLSPIAVSSRQIQPGFASHGATLRYRIGQVTTPVHGSPGIYVYNTRERAAAHCRWVNKHEPKDKKRIVVKVMVSADTQIGVGYEASVVVGPVLVVKRVAAYKK